MFPTGYFSADHYKARYFVNYSPPAVTKGGCLLLALHGTGGAGYKVAQAWDTSQGLSGNRYRFTPVRDVYALGRGFLCSTSAAYPGLITADAVAPPACLVSPVWAEAGGVRASASAFVAASVFFEGTACAHPPYYADGTAAASEFTAGSGYVGAIVSGGASASPSVVFSPFVCVATPKVSGVRNPSDDELAAMALSLVRLKRAKQLRTAA